MKCTPKVPGIVCCQSTIKKARTLLQMLEEKQRSTETGRKAWQFRGSKTGEGKDWIKIELIMGWVTWGLVKGSRHAHHQCWTPYPSPFPNPITQHRSMQTCTSRFAIAGPIRLFINAVEFLLLMNWQGERIRLVCKCTVASSLTGRHCSVLWSKFLLSQIYMEVLELRIRTGLYSMQSKQVWLSVNEEAIFKLYCLLWLAALVSNWLIKKTREEFWHCWFDLIILSFLTFTENL